jgi:HEAT repeat protein
MAKFLRRGPQDGPEAVEELIRDTDGLLPPDIKTADTQAVTNAILRRVEIIQNRGKKIKMLQTIAHFNATWVPAVFLELLADPIEEVRDVAVRELAQREDWAPAALYPRILKPPWYAKSAALRVLGLRKAVPHIRRVVHDPNADVKRAAAWCLGEIGGTEARTLLVKLTRDANVYVRSAAAEALDRLCDFKFS